MAAVTVADAAGAIASTARDLSVWADALYGGRVLSPASLAADDDDPARGLYGLGTDVAVFAGHRAYGHRGGLRGFEASMWYFPDEGVSIVLLSNQGNWLTDVPMAQARPRGARQALTSRGRVAVTARGARRPAVSRCGAPAAPLVPPRPRPRAARQPAVSMVFSWPLPASRTASPGRARRIATRDGLGPIGDEEEVLAAPPAGRLGTRGDGLEDGHAVLAAGVLVGEDDEAAALAGDAAHLRPLGRVALAGRAEDGDEPARAVAPGASSSSTLASASAVWA